MDFKEFCAQTSLHGWTFVNFDKNKIISSLFWLLAITAALILCFLLTSKNVKEFTEEVEFNVQTLTSTLDNVYFPSMYVMNKGYNRLSPIKHLFQDPEINQLAEDDSIVESVESKVITGKPMSETERRIAALMLDSNFTKQMFHRFVSENSQRYPFMEGGNLYHNHSLQHMSKDEIDNIWNTLKITAGGYYRNIFGFTQLSDFLMDLKFIDEGVLHFGGSFSDIPNKRNMFIPYFNPPLNGTDKALKEFIRPMAKAGIKHGLHLVLDAEVYDVRNTYFDEGFTIGIAHPFDSELSQFHGVDITPGMKIEMSVYTHIIETPRDIRFDAVQRNCYFDEEIHLSHFPEDWFRYSIDNCLLEAMFQQIEDTCHCTSLLAKSVPPGYNYCFGKQMQCLMKNFGTPHNFKLNPGSYDYIKAYNKTIPCLANCNDQPFTHSLTSSKLNVFSVRSNTLKKLNESCNNFKRVTLVKRYKEICSIDFEKAMVRIHVYMMYEFNKKYKLFQSNSRSRNEPWTIIVDKYIMENVNVVTVFLKDPYIQVIRRSEKMSFTTFMSNVGGLMGLCLGFSVLSAVEIIYFCLAWVSFKVKQTKSISTQTGTIIKVVPKSKK